MIIETSFGERNHAQFGLTFNRESFAAQYAAAIALDHPGSGIKPIGSDYTEGQDTPNLDSQDGDNLPSAEWPLRTPLGSIYVGTFGLSHFAWDVVRQQAIRNAWRDAA